jgi:acetolactate synthase-1/2/3 large subunit
MAKAFYIARSGRPGPVLIDITKDAQFELFDFVYEKCTGIRSYQPYPQLINESVAEAVRLIGEAKKPLVVWGQGVILGQAEEEFKTFLEKSGIPAVWTILGLSALATDHPSNRGMVGMHGNYAPNKLTNECDLLIAVGMRFDDRVTGDLTTYAKQAKIIHLELDPAEVNKNVMADVVLLADCKLSIAALTNRIAPTKYPEWIKRFDELDAIEQEKVIHSDLNPTKPGLTMGEAM